MLRMMLRMAGASTTINMLGKMKSTSGKMILTVVSPPSAPQVHPV
jgi:hypothetical protein